MTRVHSDFYPYRFLNNNFWNITYIPCEKYIVKGATNDYFMIKKYLNENSIDKYVIMISFDGFRYDYSNRVDTPNFDYIRDNGVISQSLKPIFPTFTFPNHYSLVTGCYSNKHKILGNEFYNIDKDEYYSYKKPETVQDGSWYGAEPIWVTAERQGINTATYFWVGSEAQINGYYPKYYRNYKSNVNPRDKVDQVVKWLQLPLSDRPRLICLYFNEPDHSGHVYGANSSEVVHQVKESDEILGYLISSINTLNFAKNINCLKNPIQDLLLTTKTLNFLPCISLLHHFQV